MAVSSVAGDPHSSQALDGVRENAADVAELCDGAAVLSGMGKRVASIALLWGAVAISPSDLRAHRRLAAALANAGDVAAAADEYDRYIEVVLAVGDTARAALEAEYARATIFRTPRALPAPSVPEAVTLPVAAPYANRRHHHARRELPINAVITTILAVAMFASFGAAVGLGVGQFLGHR